MNGPGVSPPACAVLLVDKPTGPTSHDIVDRVRRLTGIRKIGHAGTLDPFATGLLVMLVGRATRLSGYFTPLDKEYQVTAQFGAASTTGDIDGEITPAVSATPVSEAALRETLTKFTGVIKQRVHAYSAVKVGGEPLYLKARRGEKVEAPVREVEISRLQLEAFDQEKQQAVLTVSCSKGTYIRKLCEDLAASLGASAYASSLRRTRVGRFSAARAASLEELAALPRESLLSEANPSFISGLGALYFLPVREVDKIEACAVLAGRSIDGDETAPVRLASEGRLLAIYGPGDQAGQLRPLAVLA